MKMLLAIESPNFRLSPAALLRVGEAAPGYELRYVRQEAVTAQQTAQAEIIFGLIPSELLQHAEKLRWLHIINAGIEPYGDLRLFARRDTVLTNASGVFGIQIAEHGIGMLLGVCRAFPLYMRQMESGQWQRHSTAREVYGATAAVFGLGDLGLNVARRLRGFGCRILGVRQSILEKPPEVDEIFSLRQRLEVLRRADIVFNCLPGTSKTVGIFDREAFASMPRRSVFINLGRGRTADTDALWEALESGQLFGAGLDVVDPEPLPAEHPLWRQENVILTPHSSSASPEEPGRQLVLFCRLMDRYLSGKPMENAVNFLREY